jgi:hypothetical protein
MIDMRRHLRHARHLRWLGALAAFALGAAVSPLLGVNALIVVVAFGRSRTARLSWAALPAGIEIVVCISWPGGWDWFLALNGGSRGLAIVNFLAASLALLVTYTPSVPSGRAGTGRTRTWQGVPMRLRYGSVRRRWLVQADLGGPLALYLDAYTRHGGGTRVRSAPKDVVDQIVNTGTWRQLEKLHPARLTCDGRQLTLSTPTTFADDFDGTALLDWLAEIARRILPVVTETEARQLELCGSAYREHPDADAHRRLGTERAAAIAAARRSRGVIC